MALPIRLEKQDETSARCVYRFGAPEAPMGQVVLHKESGDIEIADPPSLDAGPNERHYLAQVVPRLRSYHERGQYPERDEWEA